MPKFTCSNCRSFFVFVFNHLYKTIQLNIGHLSVIKKKALLVTFSFCASLDFECTVSKTPNFYLTPKDQTLLSFYPAFAVKCCLSDASLHKTSIF